MEKNAKNNLLKTIILAENVLLLSISLISTLLFMSNLSVGSTFFLCSTYVLYPVILISFFTGMFLKMVMLKDYKINFVLFGINLAVSSVCLVAILYKFANVLGNF